MRAERQGLASIGGLLAATGVWASWSCCALPIGASFLGVGAGAVGSALTAWRPYLIVLSLLLAGFALFAAYRPLPALGAAACARRPRVRWQRPLAWFAVVATVAMATLPLWQSLWAAR